MLQLIHGKAGFIKCMEQVGTREVGGGWGKGRWWKGGRGGGGREGGRWWEGGREDGGREGGRMEGEREGGREGLLMFVSLSVPLGSGFGGGVQV